MTNTQKKTAKLAKMAMLVAISIVLVALVHFPIFPMVAFLEYDPADVAILIGTFLYGPVNGLIITLAASLIQGLTVSAQSGLYGILMHVIATGTLVLVAGSLYRKGKSRKQAVLALGAATVAMVVMMFFANMFITPYFMGQPRAVVMSLMPFILAFNFVKAALNCAITFIIYKPISRYLDRHDFR